MDTIQRESLFYPVTARQDWTPLPFTSFRIFTNAPHGHGMPQHQHGDCINRHMLDTSFTLCNPIDRGSGRSVNGGDSKLLRSGGVGYCLAGGRVLWMMKNGPLKRVEGPTTIHQTEPLSRDRLANKDEEALTVSSTSVAGTRDRLGRRGGNLRLYLFSYFPLSFSLSPFSCTVTTTFPDPLLPHGIPSLSIFL
ncbi:hypothetical protein SAY87_000050 [Trapa incisa]|uniref:Uncharacterized protein n=1 Tax=Trapa incisa TaxID=236973 RepID=A0AAN7GR25_9MYRT|nr:hypothetical protein SAY87_000050 [Trapa incisa]